MARSSISSDKPYRNVKAVRDKAIRTRISSPRLSHDGLPGAGMRGNLKTLLFSGPVVPFADKFFGPIPYLRDMLLIGT
jgi:hypothetical protein